jgi:hypothetical protein
MFEKYPSLGRYTTDGKAAPGDRLYGDWTGLRRSFGVCAENLNSPSENRIYLGIIYRYLACANYIREIARRWQFLPVTGIQSISHGEERYLHQHSHDCLGGCEDFLNGTARPVIVAYGCKSVRDDARHVHNVNSRLSNLAGDFVSVCILVIFSYFLTGW